MDEEQKNNAAAELGRLGGQKTAERGPEYYAEIQAKRRVRGGGRPKNPPKAEHEGTLKIGDLEIPCAVLEDGTRVLSKRGVTKALGGKRGDAKNRAAPSYPYLCRQTTLPPFVDTDLRAALTSPNLYVPSASGAIAHRDES